MMNISWIKRGFCVCLPFLLGLLLILFSQMPVALLPYYHQSFPFVTGLIFYFAAFNPQGLNVFWVFLLGIITDLLTFNVLGFYAFGFVFIFFMTNLFQSYLVNMTFRQLWMSYAFLLFCTDVLWSFLFFLISGTWVTTGFWTVQYFFTALSYPLFCRLYSFVNRKAMGDQ